MKLSISATETENGRRAAIDVAARLNQTIAEKGSARLLLSTGASQFAFFEYLITLDVDWQHVDMFHLDEYIGLPETHPASFRKYLKERFSSRIPLRSTHFVEAEQEFPTILTTPETTKSNWFVVPELSVCLPIFVPSVEAPYIFKLPFTFTDTGPILLSIPPRKNATPSPEL